MVVSGRAKASVPPPAGNGTTIVTGLLGQLGSAITAVELIDKLTAATAATAPTTEVKRPTTFTDFFILSPRTLIKISKTTVTDYIKLKLIPTAKLLLNKSLHHSQIAHGYLQPYRGHKGSSPSNLLIA
jgi:hypothetical protein